MKGQISAEASSLPISVNVLVVNYTLFLVNYSILLNEKYILSKDKMKQLVLSTQIAKDQS